MTPRFFTTIALVLWSVSAFAQAPTGPAGTVRYYHADAVGSIRAVTDANGNVVARHDYFPFGDEPANAPNPAAQRFTGQERDRENGMDYFGARYYMQRPGRFTTVDPRMGTELALVDPQRWNRYSYVGNRPTRLVDPDGRGWLSAVFKLVVKGGDLAAATAGIVEDASTLLSLDVNVNEGRRLLAVASLTSEFLPVSGRDAKAAWGFARRADDVGDAASSFTRGNFRKGLGELTGEIPDAAHAHHMLPLKFADRFEAARLNVNDPRYGAWWAAQDHLRNARGYNDRWEQFFRDNPNATADQILEFGKTLAGEYGLIIHY
jgi:RHS repeat-associated protein